MGFFLRNCNNTKSFPHFLPSLHERRKLDKVKKASPCFCSIKYWKKRTTEERSKSYKSQFQKLKQLRYDHENEKRRPRKIQMDFCISYHCYFCPGGWNVKTAKSSERKTFFFIHTRENKKSNIKAAFPLFYANDKGNDSEYERGGSRTRTSLHLGGRVCMGLVGLLIFYPPHVYAEGNPSYFFRYLLETSQIHNVMYNSGYNERKRI